MTSAINQMTAPRTPQSHGLRPFLRATYADTPMANSQLRPRTASPAEVSGSVSAPDSDAEVVWMEELEVATTVARGVAVVVWSEDVAGVASGVASVDSGDAR